MSEINALTNEEIIARTREFESDIRRNKQNMTRLQNEGKNLDLRIKENKEKLNMAQQLPHMVANVGEILDNDEDEDEEKDGFRQENISKKKKAIVVKTTGRQTIYLPVIGMMEPAMEIDERPTEEYSDIGGLDKQIQELIEAIVLPMTHKDRFDAIGIRPPKGLLMHGPPGTGKTMMARACAA